jgi:hypothetical protein
MHSLERLEQELAWYASKSVILLDSTLIFIWQLFPPANVIFAGIGVLLSVCTLDNFA